MLVQLALINHCIDVFSGGDEDEGALFQISYHNLKHHHLHWSLSTQRDLNKRVHIRYRKVSKVSGIAAVHGSISSEEFFTAENSPLSDIFMLQPLEKKI